MTGSNVAITDLAKSLGPQAHMKCLFAAIMVCKSQRNKGAASKVWKISEHILTAFAIQVLLEHVSVEKAMDMFKADFNRLKLTDNRCVHRWVRNVSNEYARKVHVLATEIVEGLAEVPADGNATSLQLQLTTEAQRLILNTLKTKKDLSEWSSKDLNAMSSFVGSLNDSIKVCADVTLTQARVEKILNEFDKKAGEQAEGGKLSPEQVSAMLHEIALGKTKGAAA